MKKDAIFVVGISILAALMLIWCAGDVRAGGFISGTTPAAAGGDFPVLASWASTNSQGGEENGWNYPVPDGIEAGDLIVFIIGNDSNGDAGGEWSQSTPNLSAAGYTYLGEAGDDTSDCHVGVFYKTADGDEALIYVDSGIYGHETVGWFLRITGANASAPIDTIAYSYLYGNPVTIGAVTTSDDNSLIIAGHIFDGADAGSFSWASTGDEWVEIDEEYSGSGASDTCGAIAQRNQATAGAGLNAVVTTESSDGYAVFQLSIRP